MISSRLSSRVPSCPSVSQPRVTRNTENAANSRYSSSRRGLFLIHWLQVQVLNDPQQLKAQATAVWAFGVCGLPLCGARAPVLCGVRSRGRLRVPETAARGSSPRSPRSAVSAVAPACRVRRGDGRLMGATGCVGPAGVTLQLALARSGARLLGRRGGSSTAPTAEREPAAPRYDSGDLPAPMLGAFTCVIKVGERRRLAV